MKRISVILLSAVLLLATSCGFIIIDQPLVDIPYWASGRWISSYPAAMVNIDDSVAISFDEKYIYRDFDLDDYLVYRNDYYVDFSREQTADVWLIRVVSYRYGDGFTIVFEKDNSLDSDMILRVNWDDSYPYDDIELHLVFQGRY